MKVKIVFSNLLHLYACLNCAKFFISKCIRLSALKKKKEGQVQEVGM